MTATDIVGIDFQFRLGIDPGLAGEQKGLAGLVAVGASGMLAHGDPPLEDAFRAVVQDVAVGFAAGAPGRCMVDDGGGVELLAAATKAGPVEADRSAGFAEFDGNLVAPHAGSRCQHEVLVRGIAGDLHFRRRDIDGVGRVVLHPVVTQPGPAFQHDFLDQVGKVVAGADMVDDKGERCLASEHDEVARMPRQALGAGSPGKGDPERFVNRDAIGDLQDQSVGEPGGVESDEVLARKAGDAPEMVPDNVVPVLDGTGKGHQLDTVGQRAMTPHPAAVDEDRGGVVLDVHQIRRAPREGPRSTRKAPSDRCTSSPRPCAWEDPGR